MKRLIERSGTGILCLILSACATADLTPKDCRYYGVDVPDGAEVRGVIVEENYADIQKVSAVCQRPFKPVRGCALAVWPGYGDTPSEWVLWAVDEYSMQHEICHGLYATKEHMGNVDAR